MLHIYSTVQECDATKASQRTDDGYKNNKINLNTAIKKTQPVNIVSCAFSIVNTFFFTMWPYQLQNDNEHHLSTFFRKLR